MIVLELLGGTLTAREEEIRDLAARGLSNAEIASAAHISEATVKTHLRSIFAKTGTSSRAQLAANARTGGRNEPSIQAPTPIAVRARVIIGATVAVSVAMAAWGLVTVIPSLGARPGPDREDTVSFTMPYGSVVMCDLQFTVYKPAGSTATEAQLEAARTTLLGLDVAALASVVNAQGGRDQAALYSAQLSNLVQDRFAELGLLSDGVGLQINSQC